MVCEEDRGLIRPTNMVTLRRGKPEEQSDIDSRQTEELEVY